MENYDVYIAKSGINLAFRKYEGASKTLPGVIFLGGFRSDMSGTKAAYLEERCKSRAQSYVRFDYSGHGLSGGKFEDCTIGMWMNDALDIFDSQTTGPQIVIGSSMGGWIALLVALARADRVAGLIGLAAAPDFTEYMYNIEFSEEERRHLSMTGLIYRENPYGPPYPLCRRLFREAKNHLLLKKTIGIRCPVRLIQGKKDTEVPWQTAELINEKLLSSDKEIIFADHGDHRLSTPEDLELIDKTLISLSHKHQMKVAAAV